MSTTRSDALGKRLYAPWLYCWSSDVPSVPLLLRLAATTSQSELLCFKMQDEGDNNGIVRRPASAGAASQTALPASSPAFSASQPAPSTQAPPPKKVSLSIPSHLTCQVHVALSVIH